MQGNKRDEAAEGSTSPPVGAGVRHKIMLGEGAVLHGIDVISSDFTIQYASRPMLHRYGDLEGKTCYEVYMKRKTPCRNCPAKKAIKTMKPARIEFKGQEGRRYLISATPIRNKDGTVSAIETIVDVTDRARLEREQGRSETALRASESKFRDLVEMTSDWVWEVDREGRYTYSSPKVEELLGYRPDEIIGKTPFDLMPAEESKRIKRIFEDIAHSRRTIERLVNVNLHKDGRRVLLETSGVPVLGADGKLVGYRGIDRDISDRKKAEERVGLLSFIVESVHDAVIMTNTESKIVYVNRAAEEMLGYSNREMLGSEAARFFEGVPGNPPNLAQHIAEHARLQPWEGEILEMKKDGTIFPIELRMDVVKDTEGKVVGYVGFSRDISERKKSEEALRESKEKYRLLYENAHDAIFLADAETGILMDANREAERLLGYSREEIVGMDQSKLHPPARVDLYRKKFRNHVVRGWAEDYEAEIITKDGAVVPVFISAAVMELQGKLVIQGIFRDITKQRKAEEELKKFKTISDRANYGTVIANGDGKLLYVNDAFARMHGYAPDELVGINLAALQAETQMEGGERPGETIGEAGDVSAREVLHKRKDGTVFPTLMNATVIRDRDGTPLFLSSTTIDITERKKYEERLTKLNRCFLSLGADPMENIRTIVRTAGEILGGACMLYNRYEKERNLLCTWGIWKEPAGYEAEDFPEGHICYDVIQRGKEEPVIMEDLTGTKYERTDPNVKKYGLKSYLGCPVRLGREVVGSFCLCDVVKRHFEDDEVRIATMLAQAVAIEEGRKQSKEALKDSSERLASLAEEQRMILEHTRDFVYRHDTKGVFTYLSPSIEQITGYALEEWKAHYTKYMTDNPINEKVIEYTEETLRTGRDSPAYYVEIRHRDGHPILLEVNERAYYEGGVIAGIVGVARDVTARKQAEEALKASEARLRAIINTVPGVVYTALPDDCSTTMFISASIEKMIGYSPDEFLKQPDLWKRLIQPEDRERCWSIMSEARRNKAPREMEYRMTHRDGYVVHVLDRASPILDGSGNIAMIEGIMVDISERKKLQERIIQADKLSAIGEMVAGIAHELNNPLGIISGHLQLLLTRVKDRTVRARLKKMETHVQRGTKIIQNLLSFARKGEMEIEACDINTTVEEALDNVWSEIPSATIRVVKRLGTKLPPVKIDREKMRIVFTNIIKNAFQTLMAEGSGGEVRIESYVIDGGVAVKIRDTGPGVESSMLRHVFDPFFTTKKVGKGTGLGLSIAYGIVKEHGGTLMAANADGGGLVVSVELPIKEKGQD